MGRARWWSVLALLGVTLGAAGCGGGEVAEEAGWIVELLDRVPDAWSSSEFLMVVDLIGAAAAGGVAVPVPGASADEVAGYLADLPRDALVPDLLRDPFPDLDALTLELGLDPALVTGAITAGNLPENYQVLAGDFDPAAVEAAVRSDPVWADLLTSAEHEGVSYYAWGDDFESDLSRVTPVRRLGRGGRLAIDDGYLYWVPWTAGMEGLIDAGAGRTATLADDPFLARCARALEEAGVYAAVLTDRPLLDDAGSAVALGTGGGGDEAGAFWVIAAIHNNAAEAEAAAAEVERVLTGGSTAATRQPWSERVSGIQVALDDTLMVVTVRSAGPAGDWWQAFNTRDAVMAAAQG
jgi:hypothetical protein